MARRRRSALALSAEHAQQALAILIQEGKLKAGEVRKALQRRDRLIRALRASLAALGAGAARVGGSSRTAPFGLAVVRRRRKVLRTGGSLRDSIRWVPSRTTPLSGSLKSSRTLVG
jgi:hypothetical protein